MDKNKNYFRNIYKIKIKIKVISPQSFTHRDVPSASMHRPAKHRSEIGKTNAKERRLARMAVYITRASGLHSDWLR